MKNQNQTDQIGLVAITGGSGAGKTWLADRLQQAFGVNAGRLSLDDFYLDRSNVPPAARSEINFDHPDAIDWPLLEQVLDNCRRGRPTRIPRYDFATHARQPVWEDFTPASSVLVEGLWLFWEPRLLEWFDFKIYLDCPAPLRLERRLERDVARRGRSTESVREQFNRTVAPMHDQFVAPQAKWADLILESPMNDRSIQELIRELIQVLKANAFPKFDSGVNSLDCEELQPI